MPTRYARIAVSADPELAAALESVAPLVGKQAKARTVRDLAIRGAEALLEQEERRREAIEEMIRWVREPETAPWDWEVLGRVEELMWGVPPDEE